MCCIFNGSASAVAKISGDSAGFELHSVVFKYVMKRHGLNNVSYVLIVLMSLLSKLPMLAAVRISTLCAIRVVCQTLCDPVRSQHKPLATGD